MVFWRIDRPRRLLHRCRLVLSWLCTSSQGCGCSPIKRARELGSERRETVRLLTSRGVGYLRRRKHKYERNVFPVPTVYQLSDKALLGSRALQG
jgi:hypothetical protein